MPWSVAAGGGDGLAMHFHGGMVVGGCWDFAYLCGHVGSGKMTKCWPSLGYGWGWCWCGSLVELRPALTRLHGDMRCRFLDSSPCRYVGNKYDRVLAITPFGGAINRWLTARARVWGRVFPPCLGQACPHTRPSACSLGSRGADAAYLHPPAAGLEVGRWGRWGDVCLPPVRGVRVFWRHCEVRGVMLGRRSSGALLDRLEAGLLVAVMACFSVVWLATGVEVGGPGVLSVGNGGAQIKF